MARLGGTASNKICMLACAMALMTGCTPTQLDSIRPEINQYQGMILSPQSVQDVSTGLEDSDIIDNSGGDNVTSGDSSSGVTEGDVVDPTTEGVSGFDPLPYNAVAAPDYIRYLDSEVYSIINEILKDSDAGVKDKIYFRVFHSGYAPVAGTASQIKKSSIYDNKSIGVGTVLYGNTVPKFAYNWLANSTTSSANADSVSKYRGAFMSYLEQSGIRDSDTWTSVSAQIEDGTISVTQTIMLMWGNKANDTGTFANFKQTVKAGTVGVLPNLSFRIATGKSTATYVTVNKTTDVVGPRYYDHMSKTDTDRLFTPYNQYEFRDTVKISGTLSDDYGMAFYYIDGYSKTVVLLCSMVDESIDTLLGDRADEVRSVAREVLDYTEWESIQEYVPDLKLLQSGSRGID